MIRIATFNANGIRSAVRRGFGEWLRWRDCDVVAIQEMRCPEALVPTAELAGYHLTYESGTLAGRNGCALLTREPPVSARAGIGRKAFAHEGRYVEADLDLPGLRLRVGSAYVPKGGWAGDPASEHRFRHKVRFTAAFRAYLTEARLAAARDGRELLVMGDFNVAHTALDLRNAGANRNQVGFLPEEREWFGSLLSPRKLTDVVRLLHPGVKGPYSWWRWGPGPFDKDTGWRIDYHLATRRLALAAVTGGTDRDADYASRMSDHAPVVVEYGARLVEHEPRVGDPLVTHTELHDERTSLLPARRHQR